MAAKKKHKMPMIDVPASPTNVVPLKKKDVQVQGGGTAGYFSKLTSNVKGQMEIPLSPCTAVVGPNRAGKTAVLDAMRLALVGSHHIGPHDLLGLTPNGVPPRASLVGAKAESHFFFPDGKKTPAVQRSGEFQSIDPKLAENMLPMVATEELLQLGTAKMREMLFRRFGVATSVPVPAVLAEPQQRLWQEVMNISAGDAFHEWAYETEIVERLSSAGTLLRQRKPALTAMMNSLLDERERLQSANAVVGVPTDDLFQAIEAKLDIWKGLRASKLSQPPRVTTAQLESLGARLVAEAEAYRALPAPPTNSELEDIKEGLTRVADLPGKRHAVTEARNAYEAAMNSVRVFKVLHAVREQFSQGRCLACNQSTHDVHRDALVQEVKLRVQQLTAAAEPLRVAWNELDEQLRIAESALPAALQRADHEAATLRWRHDSAQKALVTLKSEYERLQKLHQQEHELPTQTAVAPPAESEEELRRQLAELQDARAVAARLSAIGTELRKCETQMADIKTVEQVLGETLTTLLAGIAKQAEAAVNAWMPEGFKAVLAFDNDGSTVCRWEVVGSDGRPHPRGAMSGAEWASLHVAIACAWTEGQPFRFLLLDDGDIAGFSPQNLKLMLRMVAKAVADGRLTQAVVAWSRPEEVSDEGWSVVSL